MKSNDFKCTNNCTDDNSSYVGSGGGGSDDAYAYVAIAMVAASAIILSNYIYAYPVYSFEKTKEGLGWSFGFRKTFNKYYTSTFIHTF